jgi:hypothetical protein
MWGTSGTRRWMTGHPKTAVPLPESAVFACVRLRANLPSFVLLLLLRRSPLFRRGDCRLAGPATGVEQRQ